MKIIAIVALLSIVAVYAQVEEIWVANREGSIDVIDPSDDSIQTSISNSNLQEPMYFAQVGDYVWVTDRGAMSGDSILRAYNAETKAAAGSVDLGAAGYEGLFHTWAFGNVVYVVADSAANNGVAVVDVDGFPGSTPTVDGVNTPASVMSGVPHDVTATEDWIYVVYLNGAMFSGTIIVQYDSSTLDPHAEAYIPYTDCHVAIRPTTNLWCQCQNDNSEESEIYILTRDNITQEVTTIDSEDVSGINITSAHGDWISDDYTFVTNIGNMDAALMVFDNSAPYDFLGSASAPYATPHNVVSLSDSSKAYVSHTIPTTSYVSVFDIASSGQPSYSSDIQTTEGTAFGIYLVTYTATGDGADGDDDSAASLLSSWL